MTDCACPKPHTATHRNQVGSCAACGRKLGEWSVTSARVDEFLDKVEEYVENGAAWAAPWVPILRAQVHRRERAGRRTFDHAYLLRDNSVEALEEATDLVLYMVLEQLRLRRHGNNEDVEPQLLLAGYHTAQAYAAVAQAIATTKGSPGAKFDE